MVMRSIETVRMEACQLAKANKDAVPNIQSFYWFPCEDEIRLVEVEEDTVPTISGTLEPFYFSAVPSEGFSSPSAVAVIRPEEYRHLKLPEGWGFWDDAIPLEVLS